MSPSGAHSAIVLSAFLVAGIYGWRWLTGGKPDGKLTSKSLYQQPLTSPEGFLVAWGLIYMLLGTLSAFAPALAGALALLILLGDVVLNFSAAAGGAIQLQQSKTRKESKSAAKRH